MVGLVGGPPHERPRIIENLQKKASLRQLQKCSIFAYFAKNSKPCVSLSQAWTNNTGGWENLEKFSNFYLFRQKKIKWNSDANKIFHKTSKNHFKIRSFWKSSFVLYNFISNRYHTNLPRNSLHGDKHTLRREIKEVRCWNNINFLQIFPCLWVRRNFRVIYIPLNESVNW